MILEGDGLGLGRSGLGVLATHVARGCLGYRLHVGGDASRRVLRPARLSGWMKDPFRHMGRLPGSQRRAVLLLLHLEHQLLLVGASQDILDPVPRRRLLISGRRSERVVLAVGCSACLALLEQILAEARLHHLRHLLAG